MSERLLQTIDHFAQDPLVKDIINSFKDNQGFDVQDNQLQYNLNAGPGKFQFGIGPNTAGINFNLPFGAQC